MAIAFSGTGDMSVIASAHLAVTTPSNRTITWWFKPNSCPDNKFMWKADNYNAFAGRYNSGAAFGAAVYTGGGWVNFYGSGEIAWSNVIDADWNFAALVYKKNDTGYLYLFNKNGSWSMSVACPNYDIAVKNASGYICIGCDPLASNYVFPGAVADWRCYHSALPLHCIETIYNSPGNDGICYDLVAQYLLNEKPDGENPGAGSSIIDISLTGLHLSKRESPVYMAAPRNQ